MNEELTPFGYCPSQYLPKLRGVAGLRWDSERKDYIILAEGKSVSYRKKNQLQACLIHNKEYSIIPKYERMKLLVSHFKDDWDRILNPRNEDKAVFEEADGIADDIRTSRLKSDKKEDNAFDDF